MVFPQGKAGDSQDNDRQRGNLITGNGTEEPRSVAKKFVEEAKGAVSDKVDMK